MFWSKARKIKELESDLDAMEKLIGSIKIQRDAALVVGEELKKDIASLKPIVENEVKLTREITALAAERDQLHRRVEELEILEVEIAQAKLPKPPEEIKHFDLALDGAVGKEARFLKGD